MVIPYKEGMNRRGLMTGVGLDDGKDLCEGDEKMDQVRRGDEDKVGNHGTMMGFVIPWQVIGEDDVGAR